MTLTLCEMNRSPNEFDFYFLNDSASAKLHYSMENLTKARPTASSSTSSSTASPASSFMSSRSCDSIYRSQKAKINPNLPVAQNTARILERAQNKQTTKNSAAAKKEVMTHQ